MSVRRTLDQERARAAWEAVQAVTKHEEAVQQSYRSLARGFAAMIQMNGIGPACAFLYAKKNRDTPDSLAYGLLLDHIESWLRNHLPTRQDQTQPPQPTEGQDWLIAWLTAATTSNNDWRRAIVETFAYLLWLRRFAEGAIADQENADSAVSASPGKEPQ